MAKLFRKCITGAAVLAIFVILYGEFRNHFLECPEGNLKVRTANGGYGCVIGTPAVDTFWTAE